MPQILRGGCSEAAPGRKRRQFLRGRGYPPPAGQENTLNPAQKVLRGGCRQEKAANPARNGIPPACRAEKHPISCAEGAPRRLRAGKGGKSCAEWVTNRLPSRKTPQFRRGRCSEAVPGRKRRQIRRGRCVESARKVLRCGSGQKKGGFFEIVAAMCRSYHNFLYFCALYNLKTLKNYVTYCRLRFY